MTAARVFCLLSGALCGASVYYSKRNESASDRLLFLAYSMIAIRIIMLLREWGVI